MNWRLVFFVAMALCAMKSAAPFGQAPQKTLERGHSLEDKVVRSQTMFL